MISVVIPTCERPELVARCLVKITGADEVIVTDDSNCDRTRRLILDRFPGVKWRARSAFCGLRTRVCQRPI
jgi:GT2 family glycosyltransferase